MAKRTAAVNATATIEALEAIRATIASKVDELAAVTRIPCTPDEALEKVRSVLDFAAARVPLDVGRFLGAAPVRADARLFLPPRSDLRPEVHSEQLLAVLCRPRVEQLFEAAISEALEGLETISALDRVSRIAELQAELHALEVEEERLIVELEAQGADVLRRGDADPAIVLAWQGAA